MKKLNQLRLLAGIPIDGSIEKTERVTEDTVSFVVPSGEQQQQPSANEALKYLNAAFKALGNSPEIQQKVKELIGVVAQQQQQAQHQPAQQPAAPEQQAEPSVEQEEELDGEDEETMTFQALANAEDEECTCMKESMLDYSTTLNLSNANSDNPTNVVKSDDDLVYDQTVEPKDESPNQIANNPFNDMGNIKIPDGIKSALTTQAKEARKQADGFERVRDFDSKNFYNDLATAFEELASHLDGTVYGMKKAQIFMSSLMGPMLHKIPAEVVKFIARGGQNRSLKDYVQAVKQQ